MGVAGTYASDRKIDFSLIHVSRSDYEQDQFDAKCCMKEGRQCQIN